MKVSEWAFDRIMEAFEQVAKDEARKVSIVSEIMIRSTRQRGKEAFRCHTCARVVTVSRWKTTFGGSKSFKLVVQTCESVNQAKVFRAHAVPQGLLLMR